MRRKSWISGVVLASSFLALLSISGCGDKPAAGPDGTTPSAEVSPGGAPRQPKK